MSEVRLTLDYHKTIANRKASNEKAKEAELTKRKGKKESRHQVIREKQLKMATTASKSKLDSEQRNGIVCVCVSEDLLI